MGAYRQGQRARGRRRTLTRTTAISIALAIAVLFLLAGLPPGPRRAIGADPDLARRTIGGAFHVHTTRSDGADGKAAVARAARRAGLQFVVFTDHGDGTRHDPPEYIDLVLCLDAVEVSTDGGHYIAVGAEPSRYPLGGESAAVVEDVARLGGFGVAAHPASPRRQLAWSDWSLPIDAMEWVNADSEWRDERRWALTRALAAYPLRSSGALAALLDRPVEAIAQWDRLASARRVLAIAGHDAHGGIGRRVEDPASAWRLGVPSYEAAFRSFSTRVELDRPLSGDAAVDGPALISAMRSGRFYTAVDAVAGPPALEFTAGTADGTVGQGSVLRGSGNASFSARAGLPDGATIVAFRNGVEVARGAGDTLRFESGERGAFRVEVHVPGAPGTPPIPWLVSNPIFRLEAAGEGAPPPTRTVVRSMDVRAARVEKDAGSRAELHLDAESGEVELRYRLRDGERANQYVALVVDLPSGLEPFDEVTAVGVTAAPSRVSVQLRFAADGQGRWRKSEYLDTTPRTVTVPVEALQRADGPAVRPDVRRATSLLFVVDLTHARPGDPGILRLGSVRLERRAP